jgi:hypothetical protein
MPDVPLCTENLVIPTGGAGIEFNVERLEYPLEYFVPHLTVCLPLFILPLLRHITVLDWNQQGSNDYDTGVWGHLADLRR